MDETNPNALRKVALKSLVVIACLGTVISAAQAQQTTENTAKLCSQAIQAEEHRNQIPPRLLAAIASVESGRWDKVSQANVAWPWTVMAEGEGKFYPNQHTAIQAVKKLQQRGISNIDVGCMQINLGYHPEAFDSLQEAFNPGANVAYAAAFLKQLREQKRSWQRAVRFYHSSDPKRQQLYGTKIYKARIEIRAYEVKQRRLARLAAANARRDEAASRRAAKATTPGTDNASATSFKIYQPHSYREQRELENRARNWAFSARKR